jgi:1,4-dihydroxy-2-naphthoyl-CoA hydrolase
VQVASDQEVPMSTDHAVAPAALEQFVAMMPFAAELGVELTAASPEQVTGTMSWAPERCTAGGVLHGGAIMAFADSVGAVCAILNLPEGATTATISSSTNMLRAVRSGEVTATSRRLHAGRSTITVQTELRDAEGRLVAQVTQAQAVLAGR